MILQETNTTPKLQLLKSFGYIISVTVSLYMAFLNFQNEEEMRKCAYDINGLISGITISSAVSGVTSIMRLDMMPNSTNTAGYRVAQVNSIYFMILFMNGLYDFPLQIIKGGSCGNKIIFWYTASIFLVFYAIFAISVLVCFAGCGFVIYSTRKKILRRKKDELAMEDLIKNISDPEFNFEETLERISKTLEEKALDETEFQMLNYWCKGNYKDKKRNEEGENCIICFDDFEEEDEVIDHPGCIHMFHPECILEWLKIKSQCPTCKSSTKVNLLKVRRENCLEGKDFVGVELGNPTEIELDDLDNELTVEENLMG